jgi:putative transposase
MVDELALLERGVLTTPAEVWDLAVRRVELIDRLAGGKTVGHDAADAAAAELGVSRRQVYAMLVRWRSGSGLASDLIPGRSSGGRGRELLPEAVETLMREVLRSKYVSRQRRSLAAVRIVRSRIGAALSAFGCRRGEPSLGGRLGWIRWPPRPPGRVQTRRGRCKRPAGCRRR